MTRLVAAVLASVLCAAAAHAQQQAAGGQLLALVAQARGQGCGGHAGTAAPLRESPALARAAQRIEQGEPSIAAAEREGYRARRVFSARFTGYERAADVAQAMARHHCSALIEPQFTDFAFVRQGSSWLVVLAGSVQLPALADPKAVGAKVLALTNQARAQARRCGNQAFGPAPPLRANPLLERAAQSHAQDMAAHEYIEHEGRDGSTPAQRITRTGYPWRSIGENVAAGQETPEDVVQGWIASPGHCANLMSPDFTEMGVAFAINMEAKAIVYWAQEFGRTR